MNHKPVLVGMNNPHSADPKFALYPYPPGCTGHRIFKLLQSRQPGVLRGQYLETFERRNLIESRRWKSDKHLLETLAEKMLPSLQDRVVVVLGNAVRDAFELKPLLVHPQEYRGVTWRQLPHPSGRCHWYNDPENREVAALLLEELYLDYTVPRVGGTMAMQEGTHARHQS